jgi:hypothetical protein
LDFFEANFINRSADFCCVVSDHEELHAAASFESQCSQALEFAVDLTVFFEELQASFAFEKTIAAGGK